MRTLPAGILAAMSDHRYRAIYILTIEPGTTAAPYYRWTNAPFPITYGLDTIEEHDPPEPAVFVQQSFAVGDIVIDDNSNQAVELTFSDINTVIRNIRYSESWAYRPVTLREVWLTTDRTVIDAYIEADGRIDGGLANFEDPTEPVVLAIVPDDDAEGATGPGQAHESSCRYRKFKGRQCGYVGAETTCDRTFTRCGELMNTPRFGGSRFAPKPGAVLRLGSGSTTVGSR